MGFKTSASHCHGDTPPDTPAYAHVPNSFGSSTLLLPAQRYFFLSFKVLCLFLSDIKSQLWIILESRLSDSLNQTEHAPRRAHDIDTFPAPCSEPSGMPRPHHPHTGSATYVLHCPTPYKILHYNTCLWFPRSYIHKPHGTAQCGLQLPPPPPM